MLKVFQCVLTRAKTPFLSSFLSKRILKILAVVGLQATGRRFNPCPAHHTDALLTVYVVMRFFIFQK